MMRRSLTGLLFFKAPLEKYAGKKTFVDFTNITKSLKTALSPEKTQILVRSEPQSGKTSLMNYISENPECILTRGEKKEGAHEGKLIGEVVCLESDNSDQWLQIARDNNRKGTVLLVDEPEKKYEASDFGDFFKNKFRGRALFFGTTSKSTTFCASTPDWLKVVYMSPQFAANPQELTDYCSTNLKEHWQVSLKEAEEYPFLATCVAESIVSASGFRVGLSAFIGYKIVDPDVTGVRTEMGEKFRAIIATKTNPQWKHFAKCANKHIFNAISESRLIAGMNGDWAWDQSRIIAEAMVEGRLRPGVFNPKETPHRKLFASAGLRMASPETNIADQPSRYSSTVPLLDVDSNAPMTAASPFGFMEVVQILEMQQDLRKKVVSRYIPVLKAMKQLPRSIDPPTTALDLVLCSLPAYNWHSLLCREGLSSEGHLTTFTYSGVPREVGGFQDEFRGAVKRVFSGQYVELKGKASDQQVDLCFHHKSFTNVAAENAMAVEMAVCSDITSVITHHDRFCVGYKEYKNSVLLCFCVEPEKKDGNAVGHRVDDATIGDFQMKNDVPILFVSFKNGLFDLPCTLLRRLGNGTQTTLKFHIDIDGIPMKLDSYDRLMPAQWIPLEDEALQDWVTHEQYSVWVRQRDENGREVGSAFKVTPSTNDIDGIKKAIKAELGTDYTGATPKINIHDPTSGELMDVGMALVINSSTTPYKFQLPKKMY